MRRVGVRPSVCLSCPSTAGRRRPPLSVDICRGRRRRVSAVSVLHCDTRNEDRHRPVVIRPEATEIHEKCCSTNTIATATRQSQTADSALGVVTWEVTSTARKVVSCVRWPATGITAHSLQPSSRLRVHCASTGRRRRATLAYEQI